jgi:hypothetical protein
MKSKRFLDYVMSAFCINLLKLHFVSKRNLEDFKVENRVDRFFLVQNTKTGKNVPNHNKIYQMAITYFQWP